MRVGKYKELVGLRTVPGWSLNVMQRDWKAVLPVVRDDLEAVVTGKSGISGVGDMPLAIDTNHACRAVDRV